MNSIQHRITENGNYLIKTEIDGEIRICYHNENGTLLRDCSPNNLDESSENEWEWSETWETETYEGLPRFIVYENEDDDLDSFAYDEEDEEDILKTEGYYKRLFKKIDEKHINGSPSFNSFVSVISFIEKYKGMADFACHPYSQGTVEFGDNISDMDVVDIVERVAYRHEDIKFTIQDIDWKNQGGCVGDELFPVNVEMTLIKDDFYYVKVETINGTDEWIFEPDFEYNDCPSMTDENFNVTDHEYHIQELYAGKKGLVNIMLFYKTDVPLRIVKKVLDASTNDYVFNNKYSNDMIERHKNGIKITVLEYDKEYAKKGIEETLNVLRENV